MPGQIWYQGTRRKYHPDIPETAMTHEERKNVRFN